MKLTLPTGWEDVTLNQFQRIYELSEDLNLKPLDYKIEVISILSGVKFDDLIKLSVIDFNKLYEKLKFLETYPKAKPIEYVKLGKSVYEISYDVSTLTAGQYIDLSTLCKEPSEIPKKYHEIVAALSSKITIGWFFGFKKDYEGYHKNAEAFKGLTMDKVFPICAFFLQVWSDLMADIPSYLNNQIETTMKEIQNEITKSPLKSSGDGFQSWT